MEAHVTSMTQQLLMMELANSHLVLVAQPLQLATLIQLRLFTTLALVNFLILDTIVYPNVLIDTDGDGVCDMFEVVRMY